MPAAVQFTNAAHCSAPGADRRRVCEEKLAGGAPFHTTKLEKNAAESSERWRILKRGDVQTYTWIGLSSRVLLFDTILLSWTQAFTPVPASNLDL